MKKSILITGCRGGIGVRLVDAFSASGWNVIGVDLCTKNISQERCHYLKADIGQFARKPETLDVFCEEVRSLCKDAQAPLKGLINNAAVQHLGRLNELSTQDIIETLEVNVAAPMLLAKAFLTELTENGVIINIGSVHAQATKPEFSAYATSKAALHGLTRALAIDLGPDVRVVTLAPAATATPMLKAGFENDPDSYQALEKIHPLRRVAESDEIAKMAVYLASADAGFLTGTTLYADGGILSRLHDPA